MHPSHRSKVQNSGMNLVVWAGLFHYRCPGAICGLKQYAPVKAIVWPFNWSSVITCFVPKSECCEDFTTELEFACSDWIDVQSFLFYPVSYELFD